MNPATPPVGAAAIRMPIHVGGLYLRALAQRGHEGVRCGIVKAWLIASGPYLEVHEVPLTRDDVMKRRD